MDTEGPHTVIDAFLAGTRSVAEAADELGAGLDALPVLADYLTSELSIDALERVESLFKTILRPAFEGEPTGEDARTIARFQRDIGFLLKYKPYAVKCTNPLGYAIFLQNPGEGFSFQRHREHKVEVFHIVDAHPGAFAFICDFPTWESIFDPEAFAAWLAGAADGRYDPHRYELSPGDVLVIERLNVTHTVIGCALEEFATISTDMVDRLYDQNEGAEIPKKFDREFVRARLGEIRYPAESRVLYGPEIGKIEATPIEGGTVRVLADSFVAARAYAIDAGRAGPTLYDAHRAASIYVTGGAGELLIFSRDEDEHAIEPIPVSAGDLLTIVPGVSHRAINSGDEPLTFSEHRIAPEVAFTPST
jgi:uncharacterized RmlC-like cupin family protein